MLQSWLKMTTEINKFADFVYRRSTLRINCWFSTRGDWGCQRDATVTASMVTVSHSCFHGVV